MTMGSLLPVTASAGYSLIYFSLLQDKPLQCKLLWGMITAIALSRISHQRREGSGRLRVFSEIAAPFFLGGILVKAGWKTTLSTGTLVGLGRVVCDYLFTSKMRALKQRAQTGETKAQVELGIQYASKMVRGYDREAVKWFRLAAPKSERAQFFLAVMLHNGRGCEQWERTEARDWLRQSAQRGYPPAIATLNVWNQGIGSLSYERHASSLFLLDLAKMKINKQQFSRLCEILPSLSLRSLYLKSNRIQDAECALLAQVLPKTAITGLDLSNNEIESEGIARLAECLPRTKVELLDLTGNYLGDEGMIRLAEKLPATNIHTLHLGENDITHRGAEALAKVLPKTAIRVLTLRRNPLGEEGIIALFNVFSRTKLEIFDMAETMKEHEKRVFLSLDLGDSSLQALDLSKNFVTDRDLKDLCLTLGASKIRHLNLNDNCITSKLIKELGLQSYL